MLAILWTGVSSDPLLGWLWRSSWQAGVVAGIIFILRWTLGLRLSPRCRHAMWSLVLLRLLMPVMPESPSVYSGSAT